MSDSRLLSTNDKIRGEGHPMFGKKHEIDTIVKMKERKSKENNPMFGKSHSEESKKKISEGKKKPHPLIKCTHCEKIGGANNMKRYHLDNCKSLGHHKILS